MWSLFLSGLLVLLAAEQLPAQGTIEWSGMCSGSAPRPDSVFAHYAPCDLALPDSITLTTSPRRIGSSVGSTDTPWRARP